MVTLSPAESDTNRLINRNHPYKQASRCKHSSSQISKGQTQVKSKQQQVFIWAHQSLINSHFLGLRHTAGCVSISTASIIRQPTDDRIHDYYTQPNSTLGCISSFLILLFFFSPFSLHFCCLHITRTHTHTHTYGLRQHCKQEDIQALGDYLPTFSPVSIKSAAQRQAQLKTSFLLSSSVTHPQFDLGWRMA